MCLPPGWARPPRPRPPLRPDLDTAAAINAALSPYGNLQQDGRPTLTLSARDLASLVLEVNPDNLVVPAHAWTPWYGIYGSKSGFDSLSEAFGDLTDCIPAIETGLSSDPSMNWAIPELTHKAIVSFSDAHSLPKLGRELTVFTGQPDYQGLSDGLCITGSATPLSCTRKRASITTTATASAALAGIPKSPPATAVAARYVVVL